MSDIIRRRSGIIAAGFACSLIFAGGASAAAQDIVATQGLHNAAPDDSAIVTVGDPDLRDTLDGDPRSLSPQDEALLREALGASPTASGHPKPLRGIAATSTPALTPALTWDRSDRTVTVRRPLATSWDARIGADLTPASTQRQIIAPSASGPGDAGAGAAVADVTVPGLATLDARIDPAQDQGSFGATFKHTVPLGQDYALTVRNRYAVTDAFGPTAEEDSQRRIWTADREVQLEFKATHTAFAAAATTSSADNQTRGSIRAQQRIAGPLTVTTTLSDIGAPVTTKSITAGLHIGW